MSTIAADVLLALGTSMQLLTSLGVLRMRDPYQRLHYAAAATTVGPILLALAIVVKEGFAATALAALLIAAAVLVGGALLTHATARAARLRDLGQWSIAPDEIEKVAS